MRFKKLLLLSLTATAISMPVLTSARYIKIMGMRKKQNERIEVKEYKNMMQTSNEYNEIPTQVLGDFYNSIENNNNSVFPVGGQNINLDEIKDLSESQTTWMKNFSYKILDEFKNNQIIDKPEEILEYIKNNYSKKEKWASDFIDQYQKESKNINPLVPRFLNEVNGAELLRPHCGHCVADEGIKNIELDFTEEAYEPIKQQEDSHFNNHANSSTSDYSSNNTNSEYLFKKEKDRVREFLEEAKDTKYRLTQEHKKLLEMKKISIIVGAASAAIATAMYATSWFFGISITVAIQATSISVSAGVIAANLAQIASRFIKAISGVNLMILGAETWLDESFRENFSPFKQSLLLVKGIIRTFIGGITFYLSTIGAAAIPLLVNKPFVLTLAVLSAGSFIAYIVEYINVLKYEKTYI